MPRTSFLWFEAPHRNLPWFYDERLFRVRWLMGAFILWRYRLRRKLEDLRA